MADRGSSAPAARRACATNGERLRAALLGAALIASGEASAGCGGRDLFPLIAEKSPAAFAALEAEAARTPFRRGTLFRASRPGAPPSYIFGTLHLDDPRARLPAAAMQALERAKTILVETVDTGARLRRLLRERPSRLRAAMRAAPGERPRDLLGADDMARLEALAAQAGLSREEARDMRPAVLALTLDLPPCARGADTADAQVAAAARARGVAPQGLETMAEQLEALGPLDAATQAALLEATVGQADGAADILETTLARYEDGDLGALLSFMRAGGPLAGVPRPATPPAFLALLLDARSARMARRAAPHLARGGAFIALGAAHLPGEAGVLRALERAGFRVERVD